MEHLQISVVIWDMRPDGPDGPPPPLDVRTYRYPMQMNGQSPSGLISHLPPPPVSPNLVYTRDTRTSASHDRVGSSAPSRVTKTPHSEILDRKYSSTQRKSLPLLPNQQAMSQRHSPSSHHVVRPHPHFQYSACTGRKRAVCIGVNYKGQKGELHGCINDAKNVQNALIRKFGYKERNVVVLRDDSSHSRLLPTRKNILAAMKWLIRDAKPHDSLFFHYSGHGGQTKDLDGDETDGEDEVIFPLDYEKAGVIIDDELNAIMVKPLPAGCRLTAPFDSCHSGSILDLPYLYHTDGRVKGNIITSGARASKATPSDVVLWSGCKDSQTSADTKVDGLATGAMSYAFLTALRHNPHQSYQQLLKSVREILHKKYSQRPQLSSSHPIDTNLRFII